jgi:opacity protein-like surface antigen
MKSRLYILVLTLLALSLQREAACQPFFLTPPQSPFTGPYVGGHVGFASLQAAYQPRITTSAIFGSDAQDTALSGGVQVGYDWTCSYVLLGGVVDWDWSSPQAESHVSLAPGAAINNSKIDLNWVSTIRARGGIRFPCMLVYVTAGAMYIHLKQTIQLTNVPFPSIASDRASATSHSWAPTGGLGFEYALGYHWTMQAEMLFSRFQSRPRFLESGQLGPFNELSCLEDVWLGRIGLNYRFSLCKTHLRS